MTCRSGGVWQVERLDARQTAIAGYCVRIMCRDGWQMERLGLVLRIGRRWLALLFLLHDADVSRPLGLQRVDALPHVHFLRCSDPVIRVAALSDISLDVRDVRRNRSGIQCCVGVGSSMRYRTPWVRDRRCRRVKRAVTMLQGRANVNSASTL
jgi:hypothetical protein